LLKSFPFLPHSQGDYLPPVRIPRIIPIIRIWIVVILSPEVNLLAQKKRVGIFQLTKAHDFLSLDFTCNGDSPSPSEDIRVYIPLNKDDKSSFGAAELRLFGPIKRALQNDDEGCSVFLIDGFNNLSTPDHDFTLRGIRVLKNLLEGERLICLSSQLLGNRQTSLKKNKKENAKDKKRCPEWARRFLHLSSSFQGGHSNSIKINRLGEVNKVNLVFYWQGNSILTNSCTIRDFSVAENTKRSTVTFQERIFAFPTAFLAD
jgi:hypothetical protein